MKISLNKANKILGKLKASASQKSVNWVNVVTVSNSNFDRFDLLMTEKVKAAQETLNQELILSHDISELKEALFAANHTSGVSKKLARIAFLKGKIAMYREGVSSLEMTDEVVDFKKLPDPVFSAGIRKDLDAGETGPYNRGVNIKVATLDLPHLKLAIEQAVAEISTLEDEIAALNATVEIDIDLSDVSKKAAGIA